MYFNIHKGALILAVLSVTLVSWSPARAGSTTPSAVTVSTPATENDVLMAYRAVQIQSEKELKSVQDRYEYTLRTASMRLEADYSAATEPARLARDTAEEALGESHRPAYWKVVNAEGAAIARAKDVWAMAQSQAQQAELVANEKAREVFSAAVQQANDDFAARVIGLDPAGAGLKAARGQLKVALRQFADTYVASVAKSHGEEEAAMIIADRVLAAAEKQAHATVNRDLAPVEEVRAVAGAQIKATFEAVTKGALAAKTAADKQARDDYMAAMKPFYEASKSSRLRRLAIWQQFQAGSISADTAVSELSNLLRH